MVRRKDPGPREWDALQQKFVPKANTERYQLRSEKGQPRGYASLGSDGIVPASQLPDTETSTAIAGIALSGGWVATWIDENTLRVGPTADAPGGVARIAVWNAAGSYLSVELTTPLTWDKRLAGAGGMQPGTSLSANTGYEIRLITQAGGLVPALVGTENGEDLVFPGSYTHQSQVLCFASCTVGTDSSEILEFHQSEGMTTFGPPVDPGVAHVGQPIDTFLRASVSTAVSLLPWVPASAIEARFFGTYVNDSVTVRSCFILDGNAHKQFEFRAIRDSQAYEIVSQGSFELVLFGNPATDFRYQNSPSSPAVSEGLDLNIIGFRLPAANQAITLAGTGSFYEDPLTTKGDLVGRSATETIRVPVGTDGQVPTADSGATAGWSWQAPTAGVADGDKGDITVSGSGAVWNIDADTVGNTELANMATKTYKGRTSGGTGDPEDVPAATLAADINASVDHGTLAGLGDDDHTQYAKLGGRAGGQTLIGGTAASNDLILESTSDASKGTIKVAAGSSFDLEDADNVVLPATGISGAGSGSGLDADLLDGRQGIEHAILAGQAGGQHLKGGTASGDDLTLESTSNATKGDVLIQPNGGSVGIGNAAPQSTVEISAASDPTLRLSEGSSTTSYTRIIDESTTRAQVQKLAASGNAIIDIDPLSADGTSAATIRLLRSTNTSGRSSLDINLGNNTTTVNTSLAGTGDSYLAANNGNVGIGTASPNASAKLDISSTAGALLVPRMTSTQRDALTPASGMIIYNTTTGTLQGYDSAWYDLSASSGPYNPATHMGGNMIANWPPITGQDDAQPEWWEEEDANIAVTDVDIIGEGIADDIHKRALKVVGTASGTNKYVYQRLTIADHDQLDVGTVISASVWVWQPDAATAKLEIVGSVSGSLGSATTTAVTTWTLLKVENITVGASDTYVDLRISVNEASDTSYWQCPYVGVGSVVRPWTANPVDWVHAFSANVVNGVDPANTNWTAASFAAATHPLACILGILATHVASTAGRQLYLRPTGSAAGQDNSTFVETNAVANGRGAGWVLRHCDDAQSCDYSVSNADVSSLHMSLSMYGRFRY